MFHPHPPATTQDAFYSDTSATDNDEEEDDHCSAISASSYEGESGPDDTVPPPRAPATTLGQMIPQHQHTLTPVFHSTQCRTVVVRSRDRDVFSEHLFQFSVSFGEVSRLENASSLLARERRKICYPEGSNPTPANPLPSSVLLALTRDKACPVPQSCNDPNINGNINDGGAAVLRQKRQCATGQVLRDVVSVRLPHLVMPRYRQMTVYDAEDCENGEGGEGGPVPLKLPPNVFVELQPVAPQQHLLGSHSSLECSTFFCTPADNTDHWVHFVSAGCTTVQDTPTDYTTSMTLTLHMPDEPLYHPSTAFCPEFSPDVMRVNKIEYHDTATFLFTLADSLPSYVRVSAGCVVSMRDLWVDGDPCSGGGQGLGDAEQQKLYTWWCACAPTVQFVVTCVTPAAPAAPAATTQITAKWRQPPTTTVPNCCPTSATPPLPATSTSLNTDPTRTCLLNESMQYTMVLEFQSVVRRLQRSNHTST